VFYFLKLLTIGLILFLYSCNSNKTDEEMKEMWSKAQTKTKIIERSGTKFNSGKNMELALKDAETRLQSGGGLFGNTGLDMDGIINRGNKKGDAVVGSVAMPINPFLWKGALETINFMPLNSADPFGGTILTDWYSTTSNENERCKLNIFIFGSELKSQNLKVTSFCQIFKNQKWVNINIDAENDVKLENAILNKAKKLRLQTG